MTADAIREKRAGHLLPDFPAFVNEIVGTLAVHSQYVLHGNFRDHVLVAAEGRAPELLSLSQVLWTALREYGYEALVWYDPVDGIAVHPPGDPAALQAAERVLGSGVVGRRPEQDRLRTHMANVVGAAVQSPVESSKTEREPRKGSNDGAAGIVSRPSVRIAMVMNYASRLTRQPGQLELAERDFFLFCHRLALTAQGAMLPGGGTLPLHNPIIWLVEGERDLPAWLTAGVDQVRTIGVGMPNLDERLTTAKMLVRTFPPCEDAGTGKPPEEEFANRTEGMTLDAMMRIARLAKERGLGLHQISDAIRVYTLGVDTNPWLKSAVREQITKGEKEIPLKVKGQDRAVGKTLDILKRAALGLSGAQATTPGSRPRGVLFFAGPTGVGKTELAKQIAVMLFGDSNACLRFDMSEFKAEHSADRLVGAPPGYVGFEAGGELTGAVRRRPFQVVLFDEIEKSHPKVLDKFLQILEDGRLTDGQGVTTHFSECVLIFTSNLGIIVEDPETRRPKMTVQPGMPYPELESTVKNAIREHFTMTLGRPELLNRLGDNIVVFDFIDAETAAGIFSAQLENISAAVKTAAGITLEISDSARRTLGEVCVADPENGGRGIGNLLESNLINPLSRALFDNDVAAGDTVVVKSFQPGFGTIGPALHTQVVSGGGR
jgi:ATP-dependent Clp protease ATP-binding subunit ClpB